MSYENLIYTGKILGKTKQGRQRELELMKDICLNCIYLKGIRFCGKRKIKIYFAIKQCSYYTVIKKLDTYLNSGVTR